MRSWRGSWPRWSCTATDGSAWTRLLRSATSTSPGRTRVSSALVMIMRNTMDNGPASGWESDQLAMAVAEAEGQAEAGEAGREDREDREDREGAEGGEAGRWAPELRMRLEAVLLVADE